MSFTTAVSLPGISGTVDDSDIVKFTATQLGDTTAGTFELFFDASDVGLETASEDVDAIELLDDGRLLISTTGDFSVAQLTGQGEDIIALTPTSLGDTTAGTWSLYFDGDDVGLTGVGVDGISVGDDGDIYLTADDQLHCPRVVREGRRRVRLPSFVVGRRHRRYVRFHTAVRRQPTRRGRRSEGHRRRDGPISTPPPIDFRVMGDVPYARRNTASWRRIWPMLRVATQFFVHLGDIKSDVGSCDESVYTSVSSTSANLVDSRVYCAGRQRMERLPEPGPGVELLGHSPDATGRELVA